MGKAGSSSIQALLVDKAADLRLRDIGVLVTPLRRESGRPVGVDVIPYVSGKVQSNALVVAYSSHGVDKRAVLDRVFAGLDEAGSRHRVVVLTTEALQREFWRADEGFLRGLDELAGRHEVRVAYYVRPQHTALESHWRQWGFRSGRPPSEDMARRSKAVHYFDTYASVTRLAPRVSFEPRPFRRDLLDLGDPAADFARHFLGVDDLTAEGGSTWKNRGLPLEVVNALRHAPDGLFWSSDSDNERLATIKLLLRELDAPESEQTRISRLVLQAFCHDTFEAGNQRLIELLGWDAGAFVPAVDIDPALRDRGLEALDELWAPRASEVELEALYIALDRAASERERGSRSTAESSVPRRRLRDRLAGRS